MRVTWRVAPLRCTACQGAVQDSGMPALTGSWMYLRWKERKERGVVWWLWWLAGGVGGGGGG